MPVIQQPGQPNDRLNREVDEILEQARSQPVSFQQRVEQKRNLIRQRQEQSRPDARKIVTRATHILLKIPILTALVFAIIGAYLAPEHGLLATLFALAAVVMVFIPLAIRRPDASDADSPRWRGRVESNLPPVSDTERRSWVDDIKRRFSR